MVKYTNCVVYHLTVSYNMIFKFKFKFKCIAYVRLYCSETKSGIFPLKGKDDETHSSSLYVELQFSSLSSASSSTFCTTETLKTMRTKITLNLFCWKWCYFVWIVYYCNLHVRCASYRSSLPSSRQKVP